MALTCVLLLIACEHDPPAGFTMEVSRRGCRDTDPAASVCLVGVITNDSGTAGAGRCRAIGGETEVTNEVVGRWLDTGSLDPGMTTTVDTTLPPAEHRIRYLAGECEPGFGGD